MTSGDGLQPLVGAVVLLEREHGLKPVLVGVARHVDERLVARRHLVGFDPGLDAVEADHGVRHHRETTVRVTATLEDAKGHPDATGW